jgi:hypothetical protein
VVRVPGYRSRGPGFDSRALQGEKKVVGVEWGPFSLVNTIEELLGRNSSGSGLENREYRHRDSSRWPRGTLYLQKAGTKFADKRRSLGRYSSLVDSVFFLISNRPLAAILQDTIEITYWHCMNCNIDLKIFLTCDLGLNISKFIFWFFYSCVRC